MNGRDLAGRIGASLAALGAGGLLAVVITWAYASQAAQKTWPLWPYLLCAGILLVGAVTFFAARLGHSLPLADPNGAAVKEAPAHSLDLALPVQESADTLLSFANTAIAKVGRDGELAELTAFLETDKPFAWWLWTGPAGVGKSRLAIEFARRASTSWNAGFLPEPGQESLSDLRPAAPTLVIIDYAASRSRWLSDAIFRLSQRDRGPSIRLLILERSDSGPWWDTVRRLHRMEESFEVLATMHKPPRPFGGLSRDELRTLI